MLWRRASFGQALRSLWYSALYHHRSPLRLAPRNDEQQLPLGARGERLAERWLLMSGYLILERNCRTRYSELDLVAVDGRTLVFVEVKTRSGLTHGGPVEAVDEDKQLRLSRAAMAYLRKHQLKQVAARFDVIAIDFAAGADQPRVKHYRSAFESALPD